MSIMNKLLSGVALSALLSFSASAQQIQGLNSVSGLICSGCTITNPIITGGSINNTPVGATTSSTGAFTTLSASSTVSGTGFSTYLASPPAIGGTAQAAGAFTNVVIGSGTGSRILVINGASSGTGAGSAVYFQNAGVTNTGVGNASALLGGTFDTSLLLYQSNNAGAVKAQIGTNVIGLFNSSGLSVSSGLANSVTLAGSATNPMIGTTAGNLILLSPTVVTNQVGVTGSGFANVALTDTSQSTDLKTWLAAISSTNFSIKAGNDSGSSSTTAYQINRGTTYNIASHTWNTSTTAGTAVQGMTLTSTVFEADPVTVNLPNIASSASALDAVCWNATGGVLTHNGSGALCSASLEELKDNLGSITTIDADTELMALKPFWGKFKDSVKTISDHRVQPFFGAHQVESVDPRLTEYDGNGKLRSVRYANITTLLTVGYQFQEQKIANLEARLSVLETHTN